MRLLHDIKVYSIYKLYCYKLLMIIILEHILKPGFWNSVQNSGCVHVITIRTYINIQERLEGVVLVHE